jgi:hypothetical protein
MKDVNEVINDSIFVLVTIDWWTHDAEGVSKLRLEQSLTLAQV